MNPALDHLLRRRSVSANSLAEPGPSEEELKLILTAAARVPDHKKLVPWRFILFQGEARARFGKVLAEVCRAEEKEPSKFRLETETGRFLRAALVIAVISRVVENAAAPEWEQVLSAGAACQNLLVAASSLGYGTQWITEWYGYSKGVRKALRLAPNERVAGFVYMGTTTDAPKERERPALSQIVTAWQSYVKHRMRFFRCSSCLSWSCNALSNSPAAPLAPERTALRRT
jgi:nitroreductase